MKELLKEVNFEVSLKRVVALSMCFAPMGHLERMARIREKDFLITKDELELKIRTRIARRAKQCEAARTQHT